MRTWNGFLAAAAVLLTLALAGCGSDDEKSSASTPETTATTTDRSGPIVAQVTGGETGDAVTANSRAKEAKRLARGGKITGKDKDKDKKGEVGVGAGAACADVELSPTDSNIPQIEAATLCLINGERADNGLAAVGTNDQLKAASLGHSRDMVTNKFFAHASPSGTTLVSRVEPTGYIPSRGDWVLGENLAYGTGALAVPKAIVQGWMDSPGHRANLLSPDYKDIGLGIVAGVPVEGRSGGGTYTTDYGVRGTFGSGGDDTTPTGDDGGASTTGKAGVVRITRAAKRRCAKRKLVAKKVGKRVRCVKRKRRR